MSGLRDLFFTSNVLIRKRLVQLPDAGSPPRRAAAPHGPRFRLLVLKEQIQKNVPQYHSRSAISESAHFSASQVHVNLNT